MVTHIEGRIYRVSCMVCRLKEREKHIEGTMYGDAKEGNCMDTHIGVTLFGQSFRG